MIKKNRWIAAAGIAVALAAGGTSALAATAAAPLPPNTIHGCVNTSTHQLTKIYLSNTSSLTCPAGTTQAVWPKSALTAPAPSTVTAQTSVTNWPESSGWANDNFTRSVTVSRESQVSAANCGSSATDCYLYSETIADNGTFVPVDGAASPNGSSSDTITAANITGTTFNGGGKLEFYASSPTPNPALVPGTADGSAKPSSTTDWYKLFFPGGTQFGLTNAFEAPWITYDWNYTASLNYQVSGTSVACSQAWNDGINPGDDGQGGSDGNITGTCPTS